MRAFEQLVITTLFILMIAFPFSRVMQHSHAQIKAQEAAQQKLEKQLQEYRESEQKKKELAQLKQMIPKSYSKQKKRFMHIVLPAVTQVYDELYSNYKRLQKAIKNEDDTAFVKKMQQYYGIKDKQKLLLAAKPHPKSLALAQAAIESAWATSRFYKKANNLFGVWSFNKNEPRVAAKGSREGQTIWLRKYKNAKHSIKDYYKTISTGHAYKEFRKLNAKSDNPLLLSQKLHRYSEKGKGYTQLLNKVIIQNDFRKFDKI